MLKKDLILLVKENNAIIYQNDFFDKIKSASLIGFRNNINIIQSINASLYIEEKVNEYYEKLLKQFDDNTQMFKDYNELLNICKSDQYQKLEDYQGEIFFVNESIIEKLKKYRNTQENMDLIYRYLLDVTNKKISEIVVDGLFKDTFYNVLINIKEMLRYNELLQENEKILDENKIKFYQTIIDIDKLSCNDKIAMYQTLKNKDINLIFYEDLRKIKDLSYQKINKSMIDLKEHLDFKNEELSLKNGVDVYDLTDKNYIMLVRTSDGYQENVSYRNCSYSLISNENNKVYSNKKFIYGYNSFDINNTLHIFECDAGVRYEKKESLSVGTRKVNRLMMPEQLIRSDSSYNEINIVNTKNESTDKLYNAPKPDFLVVFEQISQEVLEESKRLNIPIAVIKSQILGKGNEEFISYRNLLDDYTEIDSDFIEEFRRSRR